MQNIELESKTQAYSQFDYSSHKNEYDEYAKVIVEKSVALEAEHKLKQIIRKQKVTDLNSF